MQSIKLTECASHATKGNDWLMDGLELVTLDRYKADAVLDKTLLILINIVELHIEVRVYDGLIGGYRGHCSFPITIQVGKPCIGNALISEYEAPTLPHYMNEISSRLDAAFAQTFCCFIRQNKSKLDHLAMISTIGRRNPMPLHYQRSELPRGS